MVKLNNDCIYTIINNNNKLQLAFYILRSDIVRIAELFNTSVNVTYCFDSEVLIVDGFIKIKEKISLDSLNLLINYLKSKGE